VTRSLLASVKERKLTYYTVFQITITTAYLIRIKYPFSSFNYRLSDVNFANFNKIHSTVSEQQLFKNGTQKQKFPIWKSRISSSYTKNSSYSLCSKWPPFARTHARSRTRHCQTARSMMFWSKQHHSSMRRCFKWSTREYCYGRRVAGARPTPHSPRDLGQGY